MSGASKEDTFGKDLGLMHEVVVTGRKAGWSREDWAKLAHDEYLMRRILQLVPGAAHPMVTAEYCRRFYAAIDACGFRAVDPLATPENFPKDVFGEIGERYILHHPPNTRRHFWSETEIDAWHAKKVTEGYEPATFADGLAWVATLPPDYYRPVVFWGSVSQDGMIVALTGREGEPELTCHPRKEVCNDRCRFLLRTMKVA